MKIKALAYIGCVVGIGLFGECWKILTREPKPKTRVWDQAIQPCKGCIEQNKDIFKENTELREKIESNHT